MVFVSGGGGTRLVGRARPVCRGVLWSALLRGVLLWSQAFGKLFYKIWVLLGEATCHLLKLWILLDVLAPLLGPGGEGFGDFIWENVARKLFGQSAKLFLLRGGKILDLVGDFGAIG